jgi:hypothetical protein
MKKFILSASFIFAVLIFTGSAEASDSTLVDADVPFTFVVGDKSFAPGRYTIKIRRGAESSLIKVLDKDGALIYTTFGISNGDPAGGKGELIFDSLDGRKVLVRIRLENNGSS